ncbi:MAG TPA: GIY-YIG nuclease family protein, partial [Kofleriaceae bacterium]|nr:GIY-YIG nuclease family protein [Kofleriaceae bacterium]
MWVVYLVRCADDSLYCGITNDLPARLAAHSAGKGAKYTRRRGPVALVFSKRCRTKQLALRIEYQIKQLPRDQKDALVRQPARLLPIVTRARREL